jgi:acyl-CoA synthetase (AMP-forming)/AMP-acid ligase II
MSPEHLLTLPRALAAAAVSALPSDGFTFIDRREREETFHYSEIYARARRSAGALWESGVRPGDRVAIILPTGQPFIDVLYGCQLLGAVPVPLYPPVRLGRLDEYYARTAAMLSAVQAVAVVTERRITRLMGQVFARYRPALGTIEAAGLASGPDRDPSDVQPDALAMVQFSSGTTVAPKPVGLTHRQVCANVLAIGDFLPRGEGIRPTGCTWLPLYHDMGLIGCVYTATIVQGPLALLSPEVFLSKPALWLRAISRHKSMISPAPNFAYALCVQRIKDSEMEGCDLSSWRIAMNGAEPVAPEVLRRFRERFAQWGLRPEALTPVYGLAEAALAVTFSDPKIPYPTVRLSREALTRGVAERAPDGAEHASVGRPLRGFSVEIRSADGEVLPAGRVGHIWIKGPSLMKGYLDRDEQPFKDGWLHSGDLGFLLEEELFISGRAKDVIILRGQNHAPHDLEQAVDVVDGIRTGCAVAVGDVSPDGERLLLFVEHRGAPREGMAEDCRKAVLAATGLNPDLVLVLAPGTLPRTSSGKLRRAEALRQHRDGALAPPDKVTPWLIAGAMARSMLGYAQSRR